MSLRAIRAKLGGAKQFGKTILQKRPYQWTNGNHAARHGQYCGRVKNQSDNQIDTPDVRILTRGTSEHIMAYFGANSCINECATVRQRAFTESLMELSSLSTSSMNEMTKSINLCFHIFSKCSCMIKNEIS